MPEKRDIQEVVYDNLSRGIQALDWAASQGNPLLPNQREQLRSIRRKLAALQQNIKDMNLAAEGELIDKDELGELLGMDPDAALKKLKDQPQTFPLATMVKRALFDPCLGRKSVPIQHAGFSNTLPERKFV